MSIWSTLLGADNVINKAADGIDAAFFTDEEKAKHFLETLKHYEPFKIAQRLMALCVGVPYVLMYIVAALFLVFGVATETDSAINASKTLAEMNNETLGMPFALIVGFYFAGGMANGIVDKFKK